ncbi:MAG: phosphoglucosamine mutase [Betaproteobacteria bacterium]|nr:phosphoglucosamine mutase [Betaproteobacteria bacterium]
MTSTRKYFGTDGVRGRVGESPITPDFVMRLGYAAGKVLARKEIRPAGQHSAVVIGKDTRISGYMLEAALEAGLSAAGVDVHLAGPMPTPAVAYLTRALRLSAGIVISASHNPFEDNGIKFFSASGDKLTDAVEAEIEDGLCQTLSVSPSAQLGKVWRLRDAAGRYIEFCKSTFPSNQNLRGLKIVVDCAHGACYHIAPHVLHELGAEVIEIGTQPDGMNINQNCGAVHPQAMAEAVRTHGADIGLALDGDGDRLIFADQQGKLYYGDELLYIIARHRKAAGTLKGGIVGTLMTNLGFEHALGRMGVPFKRASVGDRYVLEKLHEAGWEVGGENSGHIICLDKHTTGDGIVAALQVLFAMRAMGTALPELTADLTMYPQVLLNVRMAVRSELRTHPRVQAAVKDAESQLNGKGRVLLRPSGTEPVLRVMVEGEPGPLVRTLAEGIAATVKEVAEAA